MKVASTIEELQGILSRVKGAMEKATAAACERVVEEFHDNLDDYFKPWEISERWEKRKEYLAGLRPPTFPGRAKHWGKVPPDPKYQGGKHAGLFTGALRDSISFKGTEQAPHGHVGHVLLKNNETYHVYIDEDDPGTISVFFMLGQQKGNIVEPGDIVKLAATGAAGVIRRAI